ncbi:MAG: hypothetical protein Q7S22_06430 [Candidatus Micrarchaeota archaeon]|nr:hypothetical protein [Candidatus Micrarchaeota archaeon]
MRNGSAITSKEFVNLKKKTEIDEELLQNLVDGLIDIQKNRIKRVR